MLTELLIVALAAAVGWEILRYFIPYEIPARLAPLVVVLISFLFTLAIHSSVILAFASAGGVAIFHKITDASSPEPFTFKFPRSNKKMSIDSRSFTSGTHRIPSL